MESIEKGQMLRAFNTTLESIGCAVLSFLKGIATPFQMFWATLLKGWKRKLYTHEYLLVSAIIANMQTDPRLTCLFEDLPQDGRKLTMQEWLDLLNAVREYCSWLPQALYFDDKDGGPFVKLNVTRRFLIFSFCNVTVKLWRRRDLFTDEVLELVFSRFIVEPVIAKRKDVMNLLGLDKDNQVFEQSSAIPMVHKLVNSHEEDGLDK